MIKRKFLWGWQVLFVVVTLLLISIPRASATGRLGAYLIRMVPQGKDAQNFSGESWGFGLHAISPVPKLPEIIAGMAGIEVTNLLSSTTQFIDRQTGLRVEQQTDQTYARIFVGPQVGGLGKGFFRPHLGSNLALVIYDIHTDVVIPDDYDRENEIRQSLRSEIKAVFGYDFTLGMDFNINNKIALDVGARFLKSFSVPQQLGEGSVKIHPQYFQIYFSVAATFDLFKEKPKGGEDNAEDD